MSIYTTQLRWIVERKQQEAGADPTDFSPAYGYLGLDTYPIFSESYRKQLNDKIITHFYFREIGFETAAQFAWFLRRTMNENMPYFNKLYLSENVITDPLTNKKYSWTETYTRAQDEATNVEGSTIKTNGVEISERVDDDLTHGKTNVVESETTFGKTHTDRDTTTFGKTVEDTSTTNYGRTQSTENGGSDTMLEGATHERVINSDTPMNQISNSGVENLNYATEVTYTDREGQTASVTEYGGTTDISNGGSDTTNGSSEEGGTQILDTSKREGGSESVDTTSTNSGKDQRDIVTSRTEDETGSGSSSTETSRDLDESGSRSHNVIGYDGIAPADLLLKWRDTFLNIDMQVIASLETLFMGLWN